MSQRKTIQLKKQKKETNLGRNEEETFVFTLMNLIETPEFNIHVLLQNLMYAMQRKNRAAIDLMINSLYHFFEE